MAKVNLMCMECGKKFKVSEHATDPRCPKCGSVDWEVEMPPVRKVTFRNYSVGPWDYAMEVA